MQSLLVLGRGNSSNPVERNMEDSGAAYLGGVIPVKRQQHQRARPVEKGTRLFVDGRARGSIPLAANLAKPGSHAIRLEIPGWLPYTLKVANPIRLPVGKGEIESRPPVFVNCRTGEIFTAQKLPSLDPYQGSSAGGNPNITFRVGPDPMFIVTTTNKHDRAWNKLGEMQPAAAARR